MSTPAQIAANQANSKLSTGATSEAGKKLVSQNSLKYGLCSKVLAAVRPTSRPAQGTVPGGPNKEKLK